MSGLEWLEAASYLVTIVGLPFAIGVYFYDRRREQQTDEEEIFLRLSDEYAAFMRLVRPTKNTCTSWCKNCARLARMP